MTESMFTALSQLKQLGYAVVVFAPDELIGAHPRKVEDNLIEVAWPIIEELQ